MNKIFKYGLPLVVAAFGLTACSDSDDNYQQGAWDASEGYVDVAFPKTSINEELDPSDPTETTLTLLRRNTSGEATVPFDVLANTDSVFTIGTAHFADGDSATTFTVSFHDAEVGKPYTLKLQVTDPQYASAIYGNDASLTYTVTRVKWNDVGYYIDDDGNKVEGWAMYTDDFVTAVFGVSNLSFPTRIQERDDMKGYFRLINTYGENYPYNDPGDWDADNNYYIYIDATDPDEVYIPQRCPIGVDWGYGPMAVFSLSGYYLEKYATSKDAADLNTAIENLGTYANGKITFPVNSLLFNYGTGGLYTANGSGAFKLVIDPSLDLYVADVKTDFTWTKVYDGAFTSEQLDSKGTKALYEGTCTATKDDADKTFAKTYGTLYRLEAPYAEGYDLYFTVDSAGNVRVPEGYELQPTGLDAVGTPVYAKISGANSSYDGVQLKLNITFQDSKGEMVYGKADEQLIHLTYKEVGTGVYTYGVGQLSQGAESAYEGTEEATLFRCNEMPEKYYLAPWAASEEGFNFTVSEEDGKIRFYQNTGEAYYDYGDIYFIDLEAYNPSYTSYLGEYDEESKTYEFNGAYYVPAAGGGFGLVTETFTLNAEAPVDDPVAAAPRRVAHPDNVLKLAFKRYKVSNRFGRPQPAKKIQLF